MSPENNSASSLAGKIAVVTGAGRGIGRSIAQTLAAAGAYVAALARSKNELAETVALIEKSGGRATLHVVDVTDEPAVRAAFGEIERAHGRIDLLVNNAGAPGPFGPFWENDFSEWARTISVNLLGPALCSHAVLPGMVSRRCGRIVNVSSGGGLMPIDYFSAYVAGKTGLIRFTENLASEIKPHGLAAFAISPGTVRTAMSEHALNSETGKQWLPWFRKIFDEGLNVPPERAAQLVATLATGTADSLSGCMISVLDDLNLLLENAEKIKSENFYSLRMRRLQADAPQYKLIPQRK